LHSKYIFIITRVMWLFKKSQFFEHILLSLFSNWRIHYEVWKHSITSSWSTTGFSLTSLTVSRSLSALLSRLQCRTNSGDFVVCSLWLSSSLARSTDIRNCNTS
jgi:hypothetical protein